MPRKDLVSLSIEALNKTASIRHLQKLVDVCLDQINDLDDDTIDTIDKLQLLLDSYRGEMDNHLHELEVALSNLKLLLVGAEQDHGN